MQWSLSKFSVKKSKMGDINGFWEIENTNLHERIFSALTFSDLKPCRSVCKSWNDLIVTGLLESAVLYVSLCPNSQTLIRSANQRWHHVRFELFGIHESEAALWDLATPLTHLRILEFKQCYISWELFKKFVTVSPCLQELIFHRSIFKETDRFYASVHVLSAQEHDTFHQRISTLTTLTITDIGEVLGMTEILERMVLYQSRNLVTLKLELKTSSNSTHASDAVRMLQVLGDLVLHNCITLRNLILNLWNPELLNQFLPFVLTPMETASDIFQLQVFKLATPIPVQETISVTLDSSRLMLRLGEFLRTQRSLQSLAFPHFTNLGAAETRRWSILDHTTKQLQKLRVPGAMYLRRNAFKSFHNLKVLFVGEKHLGTPSTFLHPTKFNVDKAGVARRNFAKIRSLSIHSSVVYETGNLFHVLEKLRNLTSLELNVLRPLLNDKDVQAAIKHLSKLRLLVIGHCDFVSDTGITGIPKETSQDMIRYSTVELDDINIIQESEMLGRPLSDLRNLVTLRLIGTAQVTDVGLKGLEFRNLKKLQLPVGKMITSSGIEQVAMQNPCLESLLLSGASAESAIGVANAVARHPRLDKDRCKVQTFSKFDGDMSYPTLVHGILWNSLNSPRS